MNPLIDKPLNPLNRGLGARGWGLEKDNRRKTPGIPRKGVDLKIWKMGGALKH